MSSTIKYVKLSRNEKFGFGFSVIGGAESEFPPVICDVIEGSPASSCQLYPGDVILEINGKEIGSRTTKEILTLLKHSTKEVILKLKYDDVVKEKVTELLRSPDNSEILQNAISKRDLKGVKDIVAKKNGKSPKKVYTSSKTEVVQGILDTRSDSTNPENDFCDLHFEEFKNVTNHSSYDNCFESVQRSLEFSSCVTNGTGPCSMPNSPYEKEKRFDCVDGMNSDLLLPNSLCSSPLSNDACSSIFNQHHAAFLRVSKSEDYLQFPKDNISSINIDLEDDVTSSLNTLLDTGTDSYIISSTALNTCEVTTTHRNNIDSKHMCPANLLHRASSSPDSSAEHFSHDSDSPLIRSVSPLSSLSPTSSMQYSCDGVYNKMCSGVDSQASSNHSDREPSNSSSLTSPDTDVPDELEWDESTPTYSPMEPVNGSVNFASSEKKGRAINGYSHSDCPSESSTSECSLRNDENKIVIKVAGPDKSKKKRRSSNSRKRKSDKQSEHKRDPDRTPTNPPPNNFTVPSSAQPLAYEQLCESDDDLTCLSEKHDENSNINDTGPIANKCATSPTLSEDESDIESLHSFHYSPRAVVDLPSVHRLAKRLYSLDGFNKTDVSRHLSKNNEFSKAVAEEYLRYFNFENDTLDVALRKFLDQFCLSGETQERERVLVHFSKRYLDCNPGIFNSQDAVHTLTCALMLLNTDLHNPSIGRKMTEKEFIENLGELNDGGDFDGDVLKHLFEAIKIQPLKWAADGLDNTITSTAAPDESLQSSFGSNPFLSPPSNGGVVYKKGYVMRKCCVDPNGKRTAFGKRAWKMWFCVIQDLVLYLHKDEQGARRGPPTQIGQNAVRLHHSLAQRAHDYAKKEHVFRLNTADQAEYLMQTSDNKELQAWIEAINYVASALSAPPMPCAVGSQEKFQRPLLPCSVTRLSPVDQLEDHKHRVTLLEQEMIELSLIPVDKTTKSSELSGLKEKEFYINNELKRYQAYVQVLKSRIESGCSLNGGIPEFNVLKPANLKPKVAVSEVDPNDPSAAAGIIPPPIPDRTPKQTRKGESSSELQVEAEGSKASESSAENNDKNEKSEKQKIREEKEFKKELTKMIRQKEKRDMKAERVRRRSSIIMDEINEISKIFQRKDSIKENKIVDITDSHKEKDVKENENKEDLNESPEIPEDPRMGTFEKLSALFKFNKLNNSDKDKNLTKIQNGMSDPHDGIEFKKNDVGPPPLPPKPSADSLVRKNLGTRVVFE